MALSISRNDGQYIHLINNSPLELKKIRVKITDDVITLYMGRSKIMSGVDRAEVVITVFGEEVLIQAERKSDNAHQVKLAFTAPMSIRIQRDDFYL
jgi:sRNA-binding carbon storage regulator CsrA